LESSLGRIFFNLILKKHGLLASGGGTADRTIRFWNALDGKHLSKEDTGS
jgi:hypothetical protein